MSGTFSLLHYNSKIIHKAQQVESLKGLRQRCSSATGFTTNPMRLTHFTGVEDFYSRILLISTATWGHSGSHVSLQTRKSLVQRAVHRFVSRSVIPKV